MVSFSSNRLIVLHSLFNFVDNRIRISEVKRVIGQLAYFNVLSATQLML